MPLLPSRAERVSQPCFLKALVMIDVKNASSSTMSNFFLSGIPHHCTAFQAKASAGQAGFCAAMRSTIQRVDEEFLRPVPLLLAIDHGFHEPRICRHFTAKIPS